MTTNAQAAKLRDVGVVGLMSHDIFSWDRETSTNTENGRLDLSTIFDYEGGILWGSGGNPKNCENSPVCTVTMTLVNHYKAQIAVSDAVEARKKTVQYFQSMVKESYGRLMGVAIPTAAILDPANNIEQAALRGMHDILPGKVSLFNRPFFTSLTVTNPLFAKLQLNEDELNQELKPFDGDYDLEYQAIKIPFTDVVINLKEVDRAFIETQSPYLQADMLAELALVGKNEKAFADTFLSPHIQDLIAKALCATDNPWMPADLPCE